jgi:branched-chain amino acid transport system permease protein
MAPIAIPARLTRNLWVLPLAVMVALIALPLVGYEGGWLRHLILIAIYTLLVSGLNLSLGFAGEVVLGQVAILALGAYIAAILYNHGIDDLAIAMLVTIAAAAVLGVITGLPGLRLSHLALGLITFFLVLLVPPIALAFEGQTGGYTGLFGVISPTFLGLEIVGNDSFYLLCVVVAGVWLVVFRNLVLSRFGLALRVLKENPVLASSLGQSVLRLRLIAYVLGSIPAGLAGCLFAYQSSYVSPKSFTLMMTIAILAASVVGGAQSVYGAPVGAALLVLGPMQANSFERYSLIMYGCFLVIVGTTFAIGLSGVTKVGLARLGGLLTGRFARPATPERASTGETLDFQVPGEPLKVVGASRAFGAVKALRGVDFAAQPGRITALIGANGAGKTTLLNAISGANLLDSGTVEVGGRDVTGLAGYRRAREGIGRTFQTPMIPDGMSVMEVAKSGCLIEGRLDGASAVLRLPWFRRRARSDRDAAMSALNIVDLAARAGEPASSLPLSTRRLLEVVRAVVGRPKVILLDEPAAGMDDDAIQELRELLIALRDAGATVVLIEHNISFVLGVADDVYVMDLGEMLASGSPEEIRSDGRVIASYLGSRHGGQKAHAPAEEAR